MIKKILLSQLSLEMPNIRFWFILIFATGILTGFQTANLEKIILLLFAILFGILSSIFLKKNNVKKIIINVILFFLLGIAVSFFKILTTADIDKTDFGTGKANFNAKIENIRLTNDVSYLTITAINPPNTILRGKKMKLKYYDNPMQISVGDIVNITTSIGTIKYNIFPNDKSYENYAKYFGIVARGKIKDLKPVSHSNKFFDMDRIRRNIQSRIYGVNNGSIGSGIVIDVLTGNNSFIPRDKLNNIRKSGCAHILAISGLHMSVIVSFVFLIFVRFFSIFPMIALKYNTRKLASIPAGIVCFIYLQIANIPISALRSFIMLIIGFIAMWSDRPKKTLNLLFLAFFMILLLSPHEILAPSFQMSFMAVFGLVSIYNAEFLHQSSKHFISNRYLRYVIGILSSSIIATIATMFFEIYHFKQYAWIGILSNIPVIPMVEFIVLPIGFIGMMFNGTFFGDIMYRISAFFADYICKITDYTANIENAFFITKQMQLWQLGIIIFGLIMLFLMRSYLFKVIGIIVAFIGIMFYIFQSKVILVYNQNFKNIVFLENDKYYSIVPMNNEYIKNVWAQNLGVKDIYLMDKNNNSIQCFDNENKENNNIKSIQYCNYNHNGKKYYIYKKYKTKDKVKLIRE